MSLQNGYGNSPEFLYSLRRFEDLIEDGKIRDIATYLESDPKLVNGFDSLIRVGSAKFPMSPIQIACFFNRESIVDLLLKGGADVRFITPNGYSCIHIAIISRKIKMLQAFMQHDIDLEIATSHGFTPLLLAIDLNDVKMCELLIERGANQNWKNNKGFTFFWKRGILIVVS